METTLEKFQSLPSDTIIRAVVTAEFNDAISRNIPSDQLLIFVITKGQANDWAIYAMTLDEDSHSSFLFNALVCRRNGDKISMESTIRSLFPCTDEVYKLYRL